MLEHVKLFSAQAYDQMVAVWDLAMTTGFEWFLAAVAWIFDDLLPAGARPSETKMAFLQSEEFQGMFRAGASALVAVVLLLALFSLRPKKKAQGGLSLAAATRRPRLYGLIGIVVLVAFFGGWSTLAPLASAAIAPGIVSPEGSRKTVEHLEGGIVKTIHVEEGAHVTRDQPLLTLENVQAKAQYSQLHKRYLHLLATEARLSAERSQHRTVIFPAEINTSADPEARLARQSQTDLFESHRASLDSHLKILEARISQLEEQNAGLADVLAAQDRQLGLLGEEIDGVQKLFDTGLERRPRLLALRRSQAELEAEQASIRAQIAENMQKIGETEIQRLNITEQAVDAANDQLADIQRILAELRSQLPSREDILQRTVIRAPISGTVMNVRVTTESGVIGAGEPIMEIVPGEASLIIDARVRPSDIDRVSPGMETRVILSAYRQRSLPLVHGTLRTVSADRLVEDRTGEPYFLAKVEVKAEEIEAIEGIQLVPGMPAEVMILNGTQTLLGYLLEPIMGSLRRGLRES